MRVHGFVEGYFRFSIRADGTCRQFFRGGLHLFHQVEWYDAVDQSPLERGLGGDGLVAEIKFRRAAEADQRGQEERDAAVGDESDAAEADHEPGLVCRDSQVTGQRHAETGARAHPIDRGEDGFLDLADLQDERIVGLLEMLAVGDVPRACQHFGDVVARAEGCPRAGEDKDARLRVAGGVVEGAQEGVDQLQVEGVGARGPIKRQGADTRLKACTERSRSVRKKRSHFMIDRPVDSPFDCGSLVAFDPKLTSSRCLSGGRWLLLLEKDRARGPVELCESVLGGVVFARVEFQFHFVAVEADPQQKHVAVGRLNIAGGDDGGGLLEAEFVAIVQVDVGPAVPGAVTAFHQRGAVERAQAREQGDGEVRAFVETHGPAVVDGFENGRRTFDDCDFIVHG